MCVTQVCVFTPPPPCPARGRLDTFPFATTTHFTSLFVAALLIILLLLLLLLLILLLFKNLGHCAFCEGERTVVGAAFSRDGGVILSGDRVRRRHELHPLGIHQNRCSSGQFSLFQSLLFYVRVRAFYSKQSQTTMVDSTSAPPRSIFYHHHPHLFVVLPTSISTPLFNNSPYGTCITAPTTSQQLHTNNNNNNNNKATASRTKITN